jgi:hypothetical protein
MDRRSGRQADHGADGVTRKSLLGVNAADREGNPFLSRTMVRAAERLREDYELAHRSAATNRRPIGKMCTLD